MPLDGTAPTTAQADDTRSYDGGVILVYTLEEAAALLHISKDTYYRRVRRGELPGRKLGGQWRIPRRALHRYAESLQGGDAA